MAWPGLSQSNSMPSLSPSEKHMLVPTTRTRPEFLIPSCYSSHKAMSRVFNAAPGLFSGGGARLAGEQEKFFPAEARNTAVKAKCYQRHQVLLPEVDNLRRSFSNDPWQGSRAPKWAGASLEVVHKDVR
eukprot:TRINITY_DN53042_c0_g1_i1.p1 TRINITY_DN53042_c0_g1~~TRINITY_DN53042_c0_g1_i1.p1  ORF type:complete len:129 (+),score=19.01 TRINITY_DN53042_c0_g1_i1:72-458(+)